MAKELTPVIVGLLLDESSSTSPPNLTSFGATGVSEADRPTRNWLSLFSGQAPALLQGSLQDAIDNCSSSSVCVIEIDQLNLEDTVYVNQSNIKFIGAVNNKVTFSGTGSIFLIEPNVSNIVFEGLNIDGRIDGNTVERDPDVYGIYLYGDNISNILIKDNHIQYLYGAAGAHGIAALGTGTSDASAIANLIIDGNNLNDLRTGYSESIVVNGNVKNWEIINNDVVRVNNIAIDAIGGEGTSPTTVVDGRIVPSPLDAARLGFIENNTVTDMSTLNNPAYGNQHSYAAGIYVDGARDIYISNNVVSDTPWAFEIGAENCVETTNITLEQNQATQSRFGDLLIGGYAPDGYLDDQSINCNPLSSNDANEGHGYVRFSTIKSNSFNSTGVLERIVELSNRIRNTVIIHPSVGEDNPDGVVSGDENSIRTSE